MPFEVATDAATAVSLADFTRQELLVLPLRERDAAGIIGELSRALARADCVPDVLSFYQAALNQELLSDSLAPSGIAVAHARLSGVKQLRFALGRTLEPLVWSVKGSQPVRLVFLLAVPATESACYLHLLSRLVRLGQTPETVARLVDAPDAPALLEILRETRWQ